MSKWLPDEVIIDILSRLPVKLLMRFRCVSKAWCSLISSPHFIASHLNRSLSYSKHPPFLLLSHNYPDTRHTLLYLDQVIEQNWDLFESPSDCLELRSYRYFLYLVGSSNGLLCLANETLSNERGSCVLWNPSIQKAISLPKPNIHLSLHQSVGFGYEPITDDYKLVRLVYLLGTDHPITFNKIPPLVEIYTLRTGIWRSITSPGPPYMMELWSSSVLVNGALHWPAHTPRCQGTFRNVIVSFNMKDEAFGEVVMPKSLQGLKDLNVTVALLDGLLALVPRNAFGNKASRSVWVMKEYGVAESWSKLFDVRIREFQRVIGSTKSGEVLVQKDTRLFSLGPSSRGYLVDLPIYHAEEIYLDTYVESLVLLNIADRVPERQAHKEKQAMVRYLMN